MSDIFFDPDDKTEVAAADIGDQTLATAFTEQVNAFYRLPRPQRIRDRHNVFSPSGVTKCGRELYYTNTNATYDTMPLVAWRERNSRNGTGVHEIVEIDYSRMEAKLREAGLPVKYRFLEAEINGEKTYNVGGVQVTLRGRSDGKIGLLDDEGDVVDVIGFEFKTKNQRKQLNKLLKAGKPQDEHKAQTVAYSLIFGISKWFVQYESLNKPDWSDIDPEKPDLATYYVEVTDAESRALLTRLAKVVEAIEKRELPPPELGLCGFCSFKTQCQKDGGYRG